MIGLKRLTRSEADSYLTTKLRWAGTTDRLFTARAITRIQALSFGVPRELERLARTCLIAGAVRGLEVINPELVDARRTGVSAPARSRRAREDVV